MNTQSQHLPEMYILAQEGLKNGMSEDVIRHLLELTVDNPKGPGSPATGDKSTMPLCMVVG